MSKNNIKQIGIIVEDLGAGQLSYFIMNNINNYLINNNNIDILYIVCNKVVACNKLNNAAIFTTSQISSFEETLIATSSYTAKMLNEAIVSKNKAFYITDLDWIRKQDKNLENNIKDILKNPDIVKFCRSKDYLEYILKNYETNAISNIEVKDFKIEQILEIING
jgi:hypothetical protein